MSFYMFQSRFAKLTYCHTLHLALLHNRLSMQCWVHLYPSYFVEHPKVLIFDCTFLSNLPTIHPLTLAFSLLCKFPKQEWNASKPQRGNVAWTPILDAPLSLPHVTHPLTTSLTTNEIAYLHVLKLIILSYRDKPQRIINFLPFHRRNFNRSNTHYSSHPIPSLLIFSYPQRLLMCITVCHPNGRPIIPLTYPHR